MPAIYSEKSNKLYYCMPIVCFEFIYAYPMQCISLDASDLERAGIGPGLAYLRVLVTFRFKASGLQRGVVTFRFRECGWGSYQCGKSTDILRFASRGLLARKFVSDKKVRLSERRTVWREIFCAREARASERQYGHSGYAGNISTLSATCLQRSSRSKIKEESYPITKLTTLLEYTQAVCPSKGR